MERERAQTNNEKGTEKKTEYLWERRKKKS